jgi:hypothetical protein
MSFKQIGFVTGSAIALAAGAFMTAPAQALTIGGSASYSSTSAFPTTLTVTGESATNNDLTEGFTNVAGLLVNTLTIASGSSTPGFNANYSATSSFLSNFQYQGQNAVLNLFASNSVVQVFTSPTAFTVNSALSGEIRSVVGNQLLGTAVGDFIATNSGLGVFSANLTATPIPTPALLPGLVALGFGVLRKRKGEVTAEPVGSEA